MIEVDLTKKCSTMPFKRVYAMHGGCLKGGLVRLQASLDSESKIFGRWQMVRSAQADT